MSVRKSPSSILVSFGVATLVGGVVSGIEASCPTAPELCTIILSRNTPGGTLGFLSAPIAQRGIGVHTFRIQSANGADVSTVNWMAIPRLLGTSDGVNGAKFRKPPSGASFIRGTTTLVGGTKTLNVGAPINLDTDYAFVMARTFGGTPGKLSAPQGSMGSNGVLIINSNSGTDTSTVDYVIIQAPLRSSVSGPLIGQGLAVADAGTAVFSFMNPMQDTEVSILASVVDPGTAGNLSAPAASRLAGGYSVVSTAAETSEIESVCL